MAKYSRPVKLGDDDAGRCHAVGRRLGCDGICTGISASRGPRQDKACERLGVPSPWLGNTQLGPTDKST
ncbi:MAG: hypothetical protein KUA37_08315 [Desulfomicrobium sp.]|nr:hypothetical protein [Desulfomicrobium sp.]MBV1719377.1 hypothetical protein [Desulfomicrobium sp.]MBV1749642.1 hypothetical protein [Desulfomicrobium sp.]